MTLLSKLTIKNLKLNKKRTIVTIIGIVLSVALITAVASIYASGIESLISYETSVKGDFHVAFYDVPVSEINTFKNNRAIETINLTQTIGYAKIDSRNEDKPYACIMAFTEQSFENLAIALTEGRLPENDTEIVIPTHLKTNGGVELNVGDTITLQVGTRMSDGYELNQSNPYDESNSEEITNSITKTYTIVGIIERPSTYIESYSAPGYTFITLLDENNLTGNLDVYAKYFRDKVQDAYKITANILGVDETLFEKACDENILLTAEEANQYFDEMDKAKYEININSYLIGLQTDPINASGIGGLGYVVIIVMIIIVVTSVFCIKNSFDISITEKIRQYGMLKSIGATKKQIRKNVFYEGTILGIIGIPIGILCGFLASFILIMVSNYFLANNLAEGFELQFSFSWLAVLIAILLGIITIYFSCFKSARRASKALPVESIRNSANIKIKSNKLKTPKFIKKLFGMGGEISYKNLKRNKKKYRTTVVSITISALVFISLYSFMDMAFEMLEHEYTINDYNLSLGVDSADCYNVALATTKLENIEEYTIFRKTSGFIEDANYSDEYKEIESASGSDGESNIIITVVGEEQYKKYINEIGLKYEEVKDKGILFGYESITTYDDETGKTVEKCIEKYSYNTGDKITVELLNDETFEIEIGAIEQDALPFGFKSMATYATFLLVSDEFFDSIVTDTEYASFLYYSENANELQEDIEELLTNYEADYTISNTSENVKIMKDFYTLIGIFLYGFIAVISLIGITNIFNTITTSMQLRRREFASLKSIGMTKKEFKRMISLESIFMGTKSLLFSIATGIGISYLMYHFLMEGEGISYNLPIVAIAIAIVAVFLLISCIMRYSMNKINKQNTIETIRNENV